MDSTDPLTRFAYLALAAIAGAITALSLMDWQKMAWTVRVMTVFVGAAFAILGVPLLVSSVMRFNDASLQVACGLTYFGGTFANAAIPLIWKKVKKKYGLEESEEAA